MRSSNDFERVRISGRSWVNHWLVLSAVANDLGHVRVGVSASRRIGGAVTRNRARRLIREAVRPRLNKIDGGWDLVFIARAPLGSATFHQVDQAVAQLLRRAKLLLENGH
ncbi:MAG: ribonuclease P protein component [Burkholderiales bacterium]|nr:ribonuclease P protein component [Burkholderiales bacterium]